MASLPARLPPTTSLVSAKPSSREWALLRERLQDVLIAIVMVFFAQLLIATVQLALNRENADFPATILAMAGLFVVFSISDFFFPGLGRVYTRWLQRPVSTKGRYFQHPVSNCSRQRF